MKGLTIHISFHRVLCSYSARLPIILTRDCIHIHTYNVYFEADLLSTERESQQERELVNYMEAYLI